jgi:hypothetical protein
MHAESKSILLIQPPIRDFYFTRKRSIPYGLISIASVLESQGFQVSLIDGLATSKSRVLDMPNAMAYLDPYYKYEDRSPFSLFHKFKHFGYSFEHIGKQAKLSGAFLVGISSLFTAYADEALEVARAVKKNLPGCRIVMGGHHPSQLPDSVMNESAVDFVIRGEGEYAMADLAHALIGGQPLETVPGLVFRQKNGQLHINPPVMVDDPDDFPLPQMALVNTAFYGRETGGSAVITASRGCPMKCSYCCVASGTSRYRRRSVDSVFSEISTAITQYNVRFIDFEDENLTLNKSWSLDLLDRISSRFGALDLELRAMNGLFPPSLDGELIETMRHAGFKTLNLSMCTSSVTQLKRFRRPDVRKSLESVLDHAGKLMMDSVCYILVGAPGQDPFESVADLIYLAPMKTLVGVSVFYPAPGSDEWTHLIDKNELPSDFSLMRSSVIPVSDSTTRLDSLTLLRLGRILNFSKELVKKGGVLTRRAFNPDEMLDPKNRFETGQRLLEAFYDDGQIRGIDSKGNVFIHETSHALCDAFRHGTRRILSPADPNVWE